MKTADELWNAFLKDSGREEDGLSGDLFFEADGVTNDSKVALILSGNKTAFFSAFESYSLDNEPLPLEDELYMVFDRAENPVCIIEIQSVTVIPFNDVTWEMAKREGEDSCLEEWRQKEREILEDEGAIMGFQFTPDLKLIFQTFKVVYRNSD